MKMSEINEARRRLKLDAGVSNAQIVSVVARTGVHVRIQMYLAWKKVVNAFQGEIVPAHFPQENGTLSGGNIAPDMPVCRTPDGKTLTCWHVPIWKRVEILLGGRLYVVAKGTSLPPMCIETEVFWK